MSPTEEIEQWLREDGQLVLGPATLTPLTGGVSCEIYRVEQGTREFVVKRALAKLRVAAEWFADVGRNAVEYEFYHRIAEPLAGSVPRVSFHNPARGYFVMEYLGGGWRNWKEVLLRGGISPEHGATAGALMGKLHAATWHDDAFARAFDTTPNFSQLRTDPYLRAAAERVPALRAELLAEADRLEATHLCLVHGDFSPKNILLQGERMMLLDAEVAWYGDPVFDIAFLQTHLHLKALHFRSQPDKTHRTATVNPHAEATDHCLQTAAAAWDAYTATMGPRADAALEARAVRLLALLMLARVDGKSPVEYLPASKQDVVRGFVPHALERRISRLDEMRAAWEEHILST